MSTPEIPEFVPKRPQWRVRGLFLFAVLLILLFLIYVWPTYWRYDHHEGRIVRFDRIDGSVVEELSNRGWVRLFDARTSNQILSQYGIDTVTSTTALTESDLKRAERDTAFRQFLLEKGFKVGLTGSARLRSNSR